MTKHKLFCKIGISHFILLLVTFLFVYKGQATPPPSLSHGLTYEHGIPIKEYLVSEKLDGIRAYWDGKQLISRKGKYFCPPSWFTKNFPKTPLDGELWISHNSFEQVASVVLKKVPIDTEWEDVTYMLFELPDAPGTFADRYVTMQNLARAAQNRHLQIIPQIQLEDEPSLEQYLDKIITAGGEGLMLHRALSPYTTGRTQDILKVKRHYDAEATVVEHLPGKGKYRGKMGALLVETRDGIQFKLGTGFSDLERINPPPIGALVTFKYFGKTQNGIPRFASFLRIRPNEL